MDIVYAKSVEEETGVTVYSIATHTHAQCTLDLKTSGTCKTNAAHKIRCLPNFRKCTSVTFYLTAHTPR